MRGLATLMRVEQYTVKTYVRRKKRDCNVCIILIVSSVLYPSANRQRNKWSIWDVEGLMNMEAPYLKWMRKPGSEVGSDCVEFNRKMYNGSCY